MLVYKYTSSLSSALSWVMLTSSGRRRNPASRRRRSAKSARRWGNSDKWRKTTFEVEWTMCSWLCSRSCSSSSISSTGRCVYRRRCQVIIGSIHTQFHIQRPSWPLRWRTETVNSFLLHQHYLLQLSPQCHLLQPQQEDVLCQDPSFVKVGFISIDPWQ